MFYKVIYECYSGTGSIEVTKFFEELNPMNVIDSIRRMPKVRKKNTLASVKLLTEVTKDEYLRGVRSFKRFCSKATFTKGGLGR